MFSRVCDFGPPTVEGDRTVAGSTRSGRGVCGGDFEGRFKRSDFGLDYGLPFVRDEVTLRVQVEGVRADETPAAR
ncbi:hypothetical protein [Methylibium sp.]|uniref:hypothetical protein n=1 Tax=Methylibium sp. TaxID=2067992 RepID=UPI003D112B26